jgi:alkylation response protein AidB-like acyl-CoA dehydrogenase
MDADEEAALLDAIQKWVDKEVRPVVQKYDHDDVWPEEIVDQMVEMGLFGATIGQEYGGLGLSAVTYAKIVALISSSVRQRKKRNGCLNLPAVKSAVGWP